MGCSRKPSPIPTISPTSIYRLSAAARWHDGKPVTPEDVIFSFDAFKKNSPMYNAYYRHIVKCERTGERDVKFTFDGPGNRELAAISGEVPVLPKHWWEGTDAQGRKRDVTATTLEIPLGSAAYRIKEFVAGRSVVLERVKDYWGKDLPLSVGQDNFDELRYEFFRDDKVGREAFKADQLDWFTERSGKQWSTAYDFPAVNEKRVIKEKFTDASSGADARLCVQPAPAAICRCQGCAAPSILPMIGRRRTGCSRTASTIATAAISTASPSAWRPGLPRGRRN